MRAGGQMVGQHAGSMGQRMSDHDPASFLSSSRSPAPELLALPLQLRSQHSRAEQPYEVRLPHIILPSYYISKRFHFNQRDNQPVLLLRHLIPIRLLFNLPLHQPYTIPFD